MPRISALDTEQTPKQSPSEGKFPVSGGGSPCIRHTARQRRIHSQGWKHVHNNARVASVGPSRTASGACLSGGRATRQRTAGTPSHGKSSAHEKAPAGSLGSGTGLPGKGRGHLRVGKSLEVPWRRALDIKRHFRTCSAERFLAPTQPSHYVSECENILAAF